MEYQHILDDKPIHRQPCRQTKPTPPLPPRLESREYRNNMNQEIKPPMESRPVSPSIKMKNDAYTSTRTGQIQARSLQQTIPTKAKAVVKPLMMKLLGSLKRRTKNDVTLSRVPEVNGEETEQTLPSFLNVL